VLKSASTSFLPELASDLEQKVNSVLTAKHTLRAAIEDFDEQACGGAHLHSTAELGRFTIYNTGNKGKINKRLYVHLEN